MGRNRENDEKDEFARAKPIDCLTIIVPVYNEESTVKKTLEALIHFTTKVRFATEVMIIESNSTDSTREIVKSFESTRGVKIVFQDRPLGKGNAVRLGLKRSSGDVCVIFDADDEYDVEDIIRLAALIESGVTSFALGTRHQKSSSMRVMQDHRFLSVIMNSAHKAFVWFFNLAFSANLTDPFTMYKMFRREIFEEVELIGNRFDLDWELVGKAILRGSIPLETPINYQARGFSEGKKIRFFYDPITWVVMVFKIRLKMSKS